MIAPVWCASKNTKAYIVLFCITTILYHVIQCKSRGFDKKAKIRYNIKKEVLFFGQFAIQRNTIKIIENRDRACKENRRIG